MFISTTSLSLPQTARLTNGLTQTAPEPFSPLAHRLFYYSYPPIKICVSKLRDALRPVSMYVNTQES